VSFTSLSFRVLDVSLCSLSSQREHLTVGLSELSLRKNPGWNAELDPVQLG